MLQSAADAVGRVAGPKESCFQKVYKHSPDGMFRLIFTDVEYYTMVDLLMSFNDTDDDTVSVIRELFNALGFQEAFEEFISSPEGRDILLRSPPEEGHA
jgi:hypothetical protein